MSSVVRRSFVRTGDYGQQFLIYRMVWNCLVGIDASGGRIQNLTPESFSSEPNALCIDVASMLVRDREIVEICLKDYQRKRKLTQRHLRPKTDKRLKTLNTKLETEYLNLKRIENKRRYEMKRNQERSDVATGKTRRILQNKLSKISMELKSKTELETSRLSKMSWDYEEDEDPIHITFSRYETKTKNLIKELETRLQKLKTSVTIPSSIKKADVKSIKVVRRDHRYYYMVLKSVEATDTTPSGSLDIGIAADNDHLSIKVLSLDTGKELEISVKADRVRKNHYKYLNSLFKEISKNCRFVFLSKHKKDTKNNLDDIDMIIKRIGRSRQAEGAIAFKIIQDTGIISKRRGKNRLRSQVLASSCMELGYAELEAPKVPPSTHPWFC